MRDQSNTPLETPLQPLLHIPPPQFQEISDDRTTFVMAPSVSGSAVGSARSPWRALLPGTLSPLRSGEPHPSLSVAYWGNSTTSSRSNMGDSTRGPTGI